MGTSEYSRLALLRWISIVWLLLGGINATLVVLGEKAAGLHNHWTPLFFTTMAGWLILAVAVPAIFQLISRYPVGNGCWQNLPVHVGAAVILGVAHAAWTAALEWIFPSSATARSFRASLLIAFYLRFHTGPIIYAVTMVVSNAIDSIRRLARHEADAARLESELIRAQMEALRRQLEPRFLFSTLSGIAELALEDRHDAAVTMIARLSDLLRRLLDESGRELVPLAEEISFAERYIEILCMRLRESPHVSLDVPQALCSALVPALILQPLVDRAVSSCPEQGGRRIRIAAEERDGIISIRIGNNGRAARITGAGTGNDDQLARFYGSACGIAFHNLGDKGMEMILTVPYRTEA